MTDNDDGNGDGMTGIDTSIAAAATTAKKGCHIRWSRITKVVDVKESSGGLLRGSIAGKSSRPSPASASADKGDGENGSVVNDDRVAGGKDVGLPTSTTKVILNEVSGEAKAGQVMALMGPSGSGKARLCHFSYEDACRCIVSCVICSYSYLIYRYLS